MRKSIVFIAIALTLMLCACTSETDKMISEAEVGAVVTFGSYEQDGNSENGAEPIEWRVIGKHGGELLLLSEYILESMPYHEEVKNVIWENSSLRAWLNEDFISSALSEEEQKYIIDSTNRNPGNSDYQIPDAEKTVDRVFLPCADEIRDGFIPEENVKAAATEYAKAKGAEVRSEEKSMWWLRCCSVENTATGKIYGATVDDLGKTFARGRETALPSVGVRPMIRIASVD